MDFARERDIERENNVQRYKRQEDQEKARESAKQDRHAGFIQSVFLLLKTEFWILLHPVVLFVANGLDLNKVAWLWTSGSAWKSWWFMLIGTEVGIRNILLFSSIHAYGQSTFSIKKLFG